MAIYVNSYKSNNASAGFGLSKDLFAFLGPSSDDMYIPTFEKNMMYIPLFRDTHEVNYRSFQQAYRNVFHSNMTTIRKVSIGKGEPIFTNGSIAFDLDWKPLFVRCYKKNRERFPVSNNTCCMIFSKRMLFEDNTFITNILRKVFQYFDSDDIIIDDNLLRSMIIKPGFSGDFDPYSVYNSLPDKSTLLNIISRRYT